MVCMKSSIGVSSRSMRRDTPAQMPSGMPTSSESSTAVMVSARVSMASCHSPCVPMNSRPAAVSRATRRLPSAHAANVASATTPSQPMIGSGRSRAGCAMSACTPRARVSTTSRISLKK